MNTAELHTLTGAYALHALGPEERAEFERHLDDCPPCAQEVRELGATAARLGLAVTVTPPAGLKEQVMRRITAERQDPPKVQQPVPGAAAGRRGRTLPRLALAACLAAATAFGGVAVWQHQEARDAQEQAQRSERRSEALASVLAAPDARVTTGKLTDGATATVVVSRDRDKAAFLASGMPEPPRGKVYQLWFDDGGTMRSAGLMDRSVLARPALAMLMDGPVGTARAMGITVEPAGGSPQPTTAPLALMDFPAA
ncbi:anti-sigma factor [Streptomyces agglomeratus]|uniref:Regulator of SigK n=1 Tax=Streptomyces agglomeratus TaxID=285458 RepID=A0A1E5PEC8_9ACTN|nr:anti-sigma factor [Streptomyces agglomeratus]OEJ27734.1 anti-sigma factor [Streptomyces agglomeratus]OEJ38206.1 anti-sigma factor [Streptomyces agglomeratus]OEJ47410.1 anti-sigma factor [Streptomyces agglomeratus]OEJ50733.1 anti-sigma factor [Streptomyces agglomeratus]OEJ58095.1 anti-sigma factor [Streptomyces agglomeratus]